MSLVDDFLFVEEKYKLNSIKVDGFTPWIYMRRPLEHEMRGITGLHEEIKHNKVSLLCKNVIRAILMLTRRDCPPRGVDVLFLSHPRRVLLNNSYECIYTDAIGERFPNSVTLERHYRYSHFSPAKTKNLLYSDRIDIFCRIHKYFTLLIQHLPNSRFKSIYCQMKSIFSKALLELSVMSGLEINQNKWVKNATLRYFYYKAAYKRIERFLKRAAPRLIIEVDYNAVENMIINELAKKMKIPTIELQHGPINQDHLAYNYPKGDTIPQLTDKLFLFGEYWKSKLSLPLSIDSIIPVGFPYFEQQMNKYIMTRKQDTKVLLFISQGLVTARHEFDKMAINASSRLSSENWRVVFKLHPLEYSDWKLRYPLLISSEVEVVGDTPPLYELLSESTAIIGFESTVIYEAIGFGLPVYIYAAPSEGEVCDLCQMGCAQFFSDINDLCSKLSSTKKTDVCNSTEIWKSNALDNMVTEIQSLLESNPRILSYTKS